MAEFKQANQAVIDALNSYQAYLKKDLLPRSHGDFRIGAETYRKKLLYDEMVDIPLDRLLRDRLSGSASQPGRVQARGGADRSEADAAADPGRFGARSSAGRQAAGDLPRGAGRLARLHPAAPHRHDSIAGAADRGRDSALHARADHGIDGHAGALRKGRQGSVLQRHSAGRQVGRRRKWKSIWKASIAGLSSARRCTRFTPDTTRSFCGCSACRPKCASCWGARRMPKVGRTTPNR